MMNISFGYENPLKARLGEDFAKSIPSSAGVYFFLDERQKPLYIGKANSLRRRLSSYFLAKPGQTPEQILEMLEHVRELVWESQPSGEVALLREAELIRTIKPPFNIALTHEVAFLFCGLKPALRANARGAKALVSENEKIGVEFRLSHRVLPEGFETFGCYLHRGKTKAGYSALLRLLAVAAADTARYNLPAKLCRTSPAYVHKMLIPENLVAPTVKLLRGESTELLFILVQSLLARDNIQAHHYASIQRDVKSVAAFFSTCAQPTKALKAKKKIKGSFLPQSQLERYTRRQGEKLIARLSATSLIAKHTNVAYVRPTATGKTATKRKKPSVSTRLRESSLS